MNKMYVYIPKKMSNVNYSMDVKVTYMLLGDTFQDYYNNNNTT